MKQPLPKIAGLMLALLLLGLLTVASAQDSAPPFLGISFEAGDDGAVVTSVLPQSPAAAAGVQVGDIITGINDTAITADNLAETVQGYAAGDQVTLSILRDDETLDLQATLGQRTQVRSRSQERLPLQMRERAFLGVSLNTVDEAVVIAAVEDGSPAAEAGLQADDVLVSINNITITTPRKAVELIGALEPGDSITLAITRSGEPLELQATLAAAPPREPVAHSMMLGAPDIVLYNPQDQTWQVMMLSEDGPLYTAGLRPNDVITAVMIDGESIAAENLAQALADAADDAQATLAVTRGDETLEITVEARALDVIGRFTGMGLFRGDRMPFQMIGGTVRLGVVYTMLDADSAAENELAVTEGALITQVLADTPAAEAGLQVNDVITAVNGQPVNVDNDLRARLAGHAAGDTITLDVQRGDEALTLEVTLAPNEFGFSLRGMGMPFNFDFGELPEFFFNPEGGFRFFGPGGRLPFDIEIPPLQPAPQTVPMT